MKLFQVLSRPGLALLPALLICGCKQSDPVAVPQKTPVPPRQVLSATSPSDANATQSSVGSVARPSGPIRFVDASDTAGIRFRHNSGAFGKKYLPETMGSGVCVLDYDDDGWQDVLFVQSKDWPEHETGKSTATLYHNNQNGTFSDVTRGSGLDVPLYGLGCAVGDFDNDGRDDVYITALDGSRLFRNLGSGKFGDVTAKAGVNSPGFATGAAWFDYDNDGKLDLFVSHYVDWSVATDQTCSLDGTHKSYCTPEAYKGQSGSLFHNLGNGVFEDVTKKAGLYDPTSKSLGIALLDFDDDGWLDLFVANDTQPNKLYRNNHNGTFTESSFATGVAFSDAGKPRAGMGADAGDYDRSGRQSLLIGNFTNESLSLYHNDGSGLFTDKATNSGLSAPSASSLTFSAFFFDYDLDGLLDIFAANGHVADDVSVTQPTVKYAEPALLFRNRGAGHFEDMSSKVGPALRQAVVGRGAAYLDYDNDGDLDVVVTTSNGAARLLRNDNGNQNDMLRVRTVGVKSNRDGIGAKVTVRTRSGARMMTMVKSGSSYLSQNELPLTFGLGKPADGNVVTVEIVWPRGRHETISGVKVNQEITLKEGSGMVAARPILFSASTPGAH